MVGRRVAKAVGVEGKTRPVLDDVEGFGLGDRQHDGQQGKDLTGALDRINLAV